MQRRPDIALFLILCATTMMGGCASSGASSAPARDEGTFANLLVLAIADDYTNRAHFERTVVSNLRAEGVSATAYYQAAGGNTPIDRDAARAVLANSGCDSLLVTRVLDTDMQAQIKQGSVAAKTTRRDERPIDFFRYDYEELDEPGSFEVRREATLRSDLYSAADENLVWSAEFLAKGADNVGKVIDEVSEKIVNQLRRDKRIAR